MTSPFPCAHCLENCPEYFALVYPSGRILARKIMSDTRRAVIALYQESNRCVPPIYARQSGGAPIITGAVRPLSRERCALYHMSGAR